MGVVFFSLNNDVELTFPIEIKYTYSPDSALNYNGEDVICLFRIGWCSMKDSIVFVKCMEPNNKLESVATFSEGSIVIGEDDYDNTFYQFCYLDYRGQLLGTSVTFQFIKNLSSVELTANGALSILNEHKSFIAEIYQRINKIKDNYIICQEKYRHDLKNANELIDEIKEKNKILIEYIDKNENDSSQYKNSRLKPMEEKLKKYEFKIVTLYNRISRMKMEMGELENKNHHLNVLSDIECKTNKRLFKELCKTKEINKDLTSLTDRLMKQILEMQMKYENRNDNNNIYENVSTKTDYMNKDSFLPSFSNENVDYWMRNNNQRQTDYNLLQSWMTMDDSESTWSANEGFSSGVIF